MNLSPNLRLTHYRALDGLRGIAAFSVFIFHKIWVFNTHLNGFAAIHNFYLAVDFFFVLSGFVMAVNYQEKLIAGSISIKKFILLRLGRIYPLHLVLTLYYGIKILLFSGGHKSADFLPGFMLNIFLLQGFDEHFCWNGPSWSISTEFWIYGLFALYVVLAHSPRLNLIFLGAVISSAIIFLAETNDNIDVWNMGYGMLRCIAGFAMGVFLYNLWPRIEKIILKLPAHATEWFMFATVLCFIIFANYHFLSFFAPLVFALMITVFGFERGGISAWLKTYPIQELGKLSYSIYMLHFLFMRFYLDIFLKLIKIHWFTDFIIPADGLHEILLGKNIWRGDFYFILASAGLIWMSYGTYSYIETPVREWARRKLDLVK